MILRLFRDTDRNYWDAYVKAHPEGSFFHLSGWKSLVEKTFGHRSHYLIYEENRKIKGVFPLFSVKSLLFGKSLVSVPFGTYGGILADDAEIEEALFQEAARTTRRMGLEYMEIRFESEKMPRLPGKDLYFVFKKEISADPDVNMKNIPRKARRMVRVGMKNGLKAQFGGMELLDIFYEMFAMSYHRLGSPVFSKTYLKNILSAFPNTSNLLVIFKDGLPLSGVLSFYDRDQVIPYYSGAAPASQRLAANDYLYWALMADAAEKGYRIFDFGRSKKDTGPYHFKRHWGFEPRKLQYRYYLNLLEEVPNISPANPKYQKRIEMWRQMPLWATKIMGPHIVRNIP